MRTVTTTPAHPGRFTGPCSRPGCPAPINRGDPAVIVYRAGIVNGRDVERFARYHDTCAP